jgi:hypothetical protein
MGTVTAPVLDSLSNPICAACVATFIVFSSKEKVPIRGSEGDFLWISSALPYLPEP